MEIRLGLVWQEGYWKIGTLNIQDGIYNTKLSSKQTGQLVSFCLYHKIKFPKFSYLSQTNFATKGLFPIFDFCMEWNLKWKVRFTDGFKIIIIYLYLQKKINIYLAKINLFLMPPNVLLTITDVFLPHWGQHYFPCSIFNMYFLRKRVPP